MKVHKPKKGKLLKELEDYLQTPPESAMRLVGQGRKDYNHWLLMHLGKRVLLSLSQCRVPCVPLIS